MTDCECWICVDANGDYAVGVGAEEARAAYENDIGPLNEADGFRLVKVNVTVPTPAVLSLAGTAPEEAAGTLAVA